MTKTTSRRTKCKTASEEVLPLSHTDHFEFYKVPQRLHMQKYIHDNFIDFLTASS